MVSNRVLTIAFMLIFLARPSFGFDGCSAKKCPPGSIEDITDQARQKSMIENFEEDIKSINPLAQIKSCRYPVEYIIFSSSGKDRSVAAICDMTNGNVNLSVMMCDDEMVGKFTLRLGGFSVSRDQVVDFVRANCPPGG